MLTVHSADQGHRIESQSRHRCTDVKSPFGVSGEWGGGGALLLIHGMQPFVRQCLVRLSSWSGPVVHWIQSGCSFVSAFSGTPRHVCRMTGNLYISGQRRGEDQSGGKLFEKTELLWVVVDHCCLTPSQPRRSYQGSLWVVVEWREVPKVNLWRSCVDSF